MSKQPEPGSGSPDHEPPSHERIAEVKQSVTGRLLAIPGVVMVGLGSKETGGAPTGELVIKVYVREKKPQGEVPAGELIPAQIDGVRTDVVLGGDIVPIAEPPGAVIRNDHTDPNRYRPATGGSRIATQYSYSRGTAGCLLFHPGDPDQAYALTCMHVIAVKDVAPVTAGSTPVGQPSGVASFTKCCDDILGIYTGGGKSADRDEAVVKLRPGMQWVAEIAEIGPVHGKHTITTQEAGSGVYEVSKRGARTGLTGGVVSSLQATTNEADNLIVVMANPNPSAQGTETIFFAYEGDSGSALVNSDKEVTGLIWARDKIGLGYAYPIDHVLARLHTTEHLDLDVATATAPGQIHTVPGGALVPVPAELTRAVDAEATPAGADLAGAGPAGAVLAPVGRPWFGATGAPPAQAFASVQRDLDGSAAGRLLTTLWLEHQAELTGLVDTNRRVTLAWHRGGGAALFQALLLMLARPGLALPRTLNGQPIGQCVRALHETLRRSASPRLRADLDRAHDLLPDFGGRTYSQIIAALGATQGG